MLEEDEANNVNCARNVEARKLKALLNARLLDIYEVLICFNYYIPERHYA